MIPERYMCQVLDEMRKCYETHNFAPILALIEEIQIMGNRMEAALGEQDNYKNYYERAAKQEKKLCKLQKEVKELEKKKEELGGEKIKEKKKGWRTYRSFDEILDEDNE